MHLGILQKGRRKHQPLSAIPRARLPWLLQPLRFLKPVSTHLCYQCAWLRDKGSIIQQAQCSPGTGKARRHLFLSSFYFAKHGLSVPRTEPHSFPAEHKGEILSSAGSWCSCLQFEGFKRAGCSIIQQESPAWYQGKTCVILTLPWPTALLGRYLTPSGPSLSSVNEAVGSLGYCFCHSINYVTPIKQIFCVSFFLLFVKRGTWIIS